MLRNKAEKSFKRKVVYGAAAVLIAGGMTLTPVADLFRGESDPGSYVLAEEKYGWQKEDGKWYYYLSGKKTYLNKTISGKLYFFDRDTGALCTGFVTYGTHTYYFRPLVNDKPADCYAVTGWQNIEGKTMFFDRSTCYQTKNEWLTMGTDKYYFDSEGARVSGWVQIDGKWYEFNSTTGALIQGPLDKKGGGSSGESGGGSGGESGGGSGGESGGGSGGESGGGSGGESGGGSGTETPTAKNGWESKSGYWYYYVDNKKVTGWKQISSKWYYFNKVGAMQKGWQQISSKWYYFDGSGAMQTGWKKISGNWFYFLGSGEMATGWRKVGASWYYFNASGVMQTGWKKIGGYWYYLDASGAMQYNWKKIDGNWYYFGKDGVMRANKSETINGKSYKFNASGVCLNP